ncbi:hypothetical protein [Parvicella tangerina]|uniref:NAD glycohydrolase translocation F5/8 type C domain-containing protein n=1 Tax=Parvicella tangerina TaxID=2829795 RepID=A0A916NB97_9FLAO|nr:hypothetical protein [Parvicella tangerina]CAG5082547.1 hypothetical protein CRYO30217_01947 [Parvicella tangerina]
MKLVLLFVVYLAFVHVNAQADTIYAKVIGTEDYRYAYSPRDYRHKIWEGWGIRNEQFYINDAPKSSDKNLKTVWSSDSAVGARLKYKPHRDAGCFCCGNDFNGVICLFNGDCSDDINNWMVHGRIKSFNIYWNDTLLSNVQLYDTWHFQYFDIGVYFKCTWSAKTLDAPYEYKMSDQLTFEIAEVYEGTESDESCFSELLWKNAPN